MRTSHLRRPAAGTVLFAAVLFAACSDSSTTTTGTAASISSATAEGLSATVGGQVGPFVFIVKDADGNVLPGVTVTFTASGPGTVDVTSGTTDNSGSVFTTVTFGHTAGTVTVTAATAGVNTTASASALSLADVPAKVVATSGGGQSSPVGTRAEENLTVLVTDQYGNPVSGVLVTWDATLQGTLGTTSIRSDDGGSAATSFTPTRVGVSTVTATTTVGTAQFTETGT